MRPRIADWTDFNESDPGITLFELFAFLAEQLQYRIEQIAAEERRRKFRRRALVFGAISCALVLAWWWAGSEDD
jgi:hypothetical protein